jgi:hypothetical protein
MRGVVRVVLIIVLVCMTLVLAACMKGQPPKSSGVPPSGKASAPAPGTAPDEGTQPGQVPRTAQPTQGEQGQPPAEAPGAGGSAAPGAH